MSLLMFVALSCTTISGLAIYLISPNQKLLGRAPSKPVVYGSTVIFSILALALLGQEFGPATSFYVFLTVLMLVLTLFPLALAFVRGRNDRVNEGLSHE